MRSHVVLAVFKRNVTSYFSGMLGYLFIIVFVVAGAFLAFDDEFFANNLCNLDQLSKQFPLLLLFIIPAITMTAWADEKKLGTDELLFTLPGSDFEILLGKYLAVLAVYTVALFFSLTHAAMLAQLGNPDWGLIATTYFGYWLAGAALVAAGMFASVLTSSATVAFVLGAAICSVPVFIDQIPGISDFLKNWLGITEPLSVAGHLRGFTSGKITYSGLFYFIGLGAFFLYLNAVMIARRHWAGGKDSVMMTTQFVLRTACLAVALLSLTYSLAVAGYDIDATSEKLHTLSATTIETIKDIPEDKPVTIQAFISPEVPQEYVSIRKELIDRLREYDARGGSLIDIRIVDVEPFSTESEEADGLGIEPQSVQFEADGRFQQQEIYMGAILTSGFDTITIPFFDRGTPIEYELTRSIGTASQETRRVIGILTTDAKVTGGFDQRSFRSLPEWQIVKELRKQYDIKEVSPSSAIETEMDVLIAIMPSSLTEPEMKNLVDYIEGGEPVLIFDDPVPIYAGLQLAPLEPKPSPGGGMMGMQQQPAEPKADGGRATSLSNALSIRWDVSQSLFDLTNPHPKFSQLPNEMIFLSGKDSANGKEKACLNQEQVITSGLQEMLVLAPGVIQPKNAGEEFTSLIRSRGSSTGLNSWEDVTTQGFLGGRQFRPPQTHRRDPDSYPIAALVESKTGNGLKAIFVADIDLVSDSFFEIWQKRAFDLQIDNVLFVLNCVDYLAGDERFIELRKRRAKHRTLVALEKEKSVYEQRRNDEVRKAEEEADKAVEEAKERLQKVLKDLNEEMKKGNVDQGTLAVRVQNATEAENRKLTQREKEIEREKNEQVRHVRIETEQATKRIENAWWKKAVLAPPIPALILGLMVFFLHLVNERKDIASDRLR